MVRPTLILAMLLLICGCRREPTPPAPPRIAVEQKWEAYDDLPPFMEPRRIGADAFDRIKSGMTLGEIVTILGRGWMHGEIEGIGYVRWTCEDDRELRILPVTYRPEDVIRLDGGSGGIGNMWIERIRRDDVRKGFANYQSNQP